MLLDFEDVITRELTPEERLLWSGAPAGGIRFRAADVIQVPFSLMWGGFAIFWEYNVLHMGKSTSKPGATPALFLALWGIPFVLFGLYFIAGRFFADAYMRARTRYGITDHRVMIVTTFWQKQVKSIPLRGLGEVSLTERSDGSGNITFGTPLALVGMGRRGRQAPPAFEFIPSVRSVHELLLRAQESA